MTRYGLQRIAFAAVLVAFAGGAAFLGSPSVSRSAFTAYPDEVRADSPWSYWRLEEASVAGGVTAADSSGLGHTGIYRAPVASEPLGRFGRGVHVTGAGGVSDPLMPTSSTRPPAPLGDFTAEMWLRVGPNHGTDRGLLFSFGEIGSSSVFWKLVGGRLTLRYARDFSGDQAVGPNLKDGLWHHLAVTRDVPNKVIRAYVDGTQVAALASSASTSSSTYRYTGGDYMFGNYLGTSNFVDIYVDEAALYTYALSGNRIAAHYAAPDVDVLPPTVTGVTHRDLPSGWTERAMPSVDVTAADDQAGIRRIELVSGSRTGPVASAPCNPSCPKSFTTTLAYDTESFGGAQLPEGVVDLSARAVDDSGKTGSSPSWRVKLDRSPPTLAVTGPLKDRAGGFVSGELGLHVEATDGTNGSPRSGVKSIEVLVDGQRADYVEQPCEQSCPLTRDFIFRADDYDPGAHTITVVAKDQLEHATTTSWQVTVDTVEPLVTGSGSLWDSDGATLTSGSYDLVVAAEDGDVEDPESGVKSIKIKVDETTVFSEAQACADGSCEMTRTWDFRPAEFPEGDLDIEITTTDHAGNSWIDNVAITVERPRSEPPQTVDTATAAGLRVDGADSGDRTGTAVASLGDLNGDGIDDYALGAPFRDSNGRTDAGTVYVVYGSDSDSTIDLAALGTGGYLIDGAAPGDRAGTAVAPAGDVNGDGLDDLLVGAPQGQVLSGIGLPPKVYVIFGSATGGDLDLATLGTRGFEIQGPFTSSVATAPVSNPTTFGARLAGPKHGIHTTVGDVNGDDLDDVVIGSAVESRNGRAQSGSTYVVFGKADSAPVDVTLLTGRGFRIDGAAAGHFAGHGAVNPGDLNSDGFGDVVVAAPGANEPGRASAGGAYVVYGSASPNDLDLAALAGRGYAIKGASGDRLGSSVASLGDVNEDDFDDMALGGRGAVVLFGGDSGEAVDLSSASISGYRVNPPSGTQYDEAVVAGAGDISGDYTSDLLVGFPTASVSRTEQGAVYAVFGKSAVGTVDLATLAGHDGALILGAATGDRLGSAIAGVDAAKETEPGLLVGAPLAAPGGRSTAGLAFLLRSGSLFGYRASAQADDPAEPTASASSCSPARRSGGYPRKTPAYCYGKPSDHPSYRIGRNNTVDRALSSRVRFGNGRRNLKGKVLTGRVPVVDSYGQRFALIEQGDFADTDPRESKKLWRVLTPEGQPIGTTNPKDRATLQVQGEACMDTTSRTNTHVMVVLMSGGGGNVATDARGVQQFYDEARTAPIDIGVRGFIERSRLPAGIFAKSSKGRDSSDNDAVIEKFRTGCGKRSGRRLDHPFGKPGFGTDKAERESQRYQGHKVVLRSDGGGNCRKSDKFRSPDCGGKYVDYGRPFTDPTGSGKATFPPEVVPLVAATTGVRNGGIVRAIVRTNLPFVIRDEVLYEDRNVPCTREYLARWRFVEARDDNGGRRIRGWFPVESPTRETRSRGC